MAWPDRLGICVGLLASAGMAGAQVSGTTYTYDFESLAAQTGEPILDGDNIQELDRSNTLDASSFSESFEATTNRAATEGEGTASGRYRGTIEAAETADSYGGSVSVVVAGTVANGGETVGLFAQNNASMIIGFSVSGGEGMITLNGLAQATGSGVGFAGASAQVRGPVNHVFAEVGTPDSSMLIDETVMLPAGEYVLEFDLIAAVNVPDKGQAEPSNATANLTFDFDVAPLAEAAEVFWNVNDGDYDVAENWEPQQVPGTGQTAVFDQDASYVVSIDNEETGRAVIERGDVTFEGFDYALTSSDTASPSLIVGRNTSNIATLALQVADVSTFFTAIGDNPNTDGTIQVSLGTFWDNAATLTVGRQGNGRLLIEDDADVMTGELRVGDELGSDGVVEILGAASVDAKQEPGNLLTAGSTAIGLDGTALFMLDNAEIETGQTEIGVGPDAVGETVVMGSPDVAFWTYTGPFIVGNLGMGTLDIFARGIVRDSDEQPQPFLMAEGVNSVGTVNVDGFLAALTTHAELAVGRRGNGALTVQNEGVVSAQSMVIGPDEGDAPAEARGEVLVRGIGAELGDTALTIGDGRLMVGDTGTGILTIENQGLVEAPAADFGQGTGGDGHLTVDQSRLEVAELFSVGNVDIDTEEVLGRATITLIDGEIQAGALFLEVESRIEGNGRIVTPSPVLLGDVAPGVIVTKAKGQTSDEPGILTFEGDATFEGATLEIDVAGPNSFDAIDITGDAGLTDVTVALDFIDGYAPETGDEFPFLTAAGNLMMQNVTFEIDGVDESFEFELVPADGTLMLMTVRGVTPQDEGDTEGSGDAGNGCAANGSEGANAIDALLLGVVALLLVTRNMMRSSRST